jgi:endo-1,4-beta-D-glucanase Y
MSLMSLLLAAPIVACAAGLSGPAPPDSAALKRAWRQYARDFVERDGKVVDPSPVGGLAWVTTSEGQSYALLRAVWMGDRRTFRRVLSWTQRNLQGGDPAALPAWKWGPLEGGGEGVLDPQPASDADQLIAYALILSWRRWGQEDDLAQALALLGSIWEQEVARVGADRLVMPGPWAIHNAPARINPSYFLPFALRAFAEVDPSRPWGALVEEGYSVLERSIQPSGLPPDWCWMDWEQGGQVAPPKGDEGSLVFGFEAFRVAWNLAADARWYGEPRALALLEGMDALGERYRAEGRLPALVAPDGQPAADWSYPGLYGALLPAWGLTRPADAEALYADTIAPLRGERTWGEPDSYFAQNWIWFGIALWTDLARPPEGYTR